MLSILVRQDLTRRFGGNALGAIWALIAPALQLALYAMVFVHIFKARAPGLDEFGYVAFLALGMWPWLAFSEAVLRGGSAYIDHAGLLGKTAIPKATLVAARVIAAFSVHGLGFLVVLAVLPWMVDGLTWYWLPMTLPAWAALMAIAFSLALMLAVANVFSRDMEQIVPFALTALMFLSPILYDPSIAPDGLRAWLELNPLAGVIDAIRRPLLWGDLSALWAWPSYLAAMALLALATLFFRRFDRHLVDYL